MVILNLPETLICRQLESPQQWYGFFDSDTVEARLMVMATEYELAEGAHWRNGVDSVIAKMQRDFPERQMDIRSTVDGFFSYCGYDELESGGPEDSNLVAAWRYGPIHYHWWRLLRSRDNEARMIDVLLNVPLPRAETPQLKALANLIHAEIEKGDFPGFAARTT